MAREDEELENLQRTILSSKLFSGEKVSDSEGVENSYHSARDASEKLDCNLEKLCELLAPGSPILGELADSKAANREEELLNYPPTPVPRRNTMNPRRSFDEAIEEETRTRPSWNDTTTRLDTIDLSDVQRPSLAWDDEGTTGSWSINNAYNFQNSVEPDRMQWRHVRVENSYQGPRNQGTIHQRYAWQIVETAMQILERESTLNFINIDKQSEITVCGDVHGQFYDLLNIFHMNGWPSKDRPYLFNGDFVDRGSFSVEVAFTLLVFKCAHPNKVFINRGNHESQSMNMLYGFHSEACAKYGEDIADRFRELFCHLPLAAVLNNDVLVMHGGLFSTDNVSLDDITNIDRLCEPPDSGLMAELLWSDPMPCLGRAPNSRGIGVAFGPDITKRFLEYNGLSLLVRSHEVRPDGYDVMHNGKLITVFSAPNYCDRMGNKGAFIRFRHDMRPKFVTFDAVPHPDVQSYVHPGIYY
eukprot:gene5769-6958_t